MTDENTNTIKKNKEALLKAGREDSLEVNTNRTKYRVAFRHQNVGRNHNLLTDNKSFENVAKVQAFGNNSNESKLHSRKIKSRLI
jgi:hypothetical protein